MAVSDIISQLHGLSESDLHTINAQVIDHIKLARKRKSVMARSNFSVGDMVGFGDRGARGKRSYKEGKVLRVMRTRAKVHVDGTVWTVPLNMLESISG